MKTILKKTLLLSLVVLTITTSRGFSSDIAQADSTIFGFNGAGYTHCAVTLNGQQEQFAWAPTAPAWYALSLDPADILYYQDLFANPVVMGSFGDGNPRDRGATATRLTTQWLPRFEKGNPHGALTLRDSECNRIGYVIAGGGDGPGVSEVAYSLMNEGFVATEEQPTPPIWGKGLATSVVGAITNIWAPEVQRLGSDAQPEVLRTKFRCFGGAQLSRLDATASPDNPGSWKALTKNGFEAAMSKLSNSDHMLDLDGQDLDGKGIKAAMLKLYDATQTPHPLRPGIRYVALDPTGQEHTFSYVEEYRGIKYPCLSGCHLMNYFCFSFSVRATS